MSKWRVTFEVDLAGLIPKQEELKPHDYPIATWAGDRIFELIFHRVSCEALEDRMNALCTDLPEETKKSMLAHYQKVHELAEAAAKSARIEEIK